MNMQSLMAQAQKMQRDLTKKKEEIDKQIFTGESEWVQIEINGKKEIVNIKITYQGQIDTDDKEALEDMIKIAFNQASAKVDKEIDEKMGSIPSGLGGLF